MSLNPSLSELARLVLAAVAGSDLALAGGGAMLSHDLIDRPTRDLDLFTPQPEELAGAFSAAVDALRTSGYTVAVRRSEATLYELAVTTPDSEQLALDIAVDPRMRPSVELAVGPVLHPDEVAADKTLALFGRFEARDLVDVDVDALETRFGPRRLLELAATKDRGFEAGIFAEALETAASRPDEAFERLGLDRDAIAGLSDRARQWKAELLSGGPPQEDR